MRKNIYMLNIQCIMEFFVLTYWVNLIFSQISPFREFQRRHICFVGRCLRYIYTAAHLPPRICTAAEISRFQVENNSVDSMIELYSKRFLLPLNDDTSMVLDLESLALDLDRAQRDAGLHEVWLTDHVIAALCQMESPNSAFSPEQWEAETNRIVMRMLVDVGFADVASRFAAVRDVQLTMPEPENRCLWNAARVRRVLVEQVGTSEHVAGRLAEPVQEKLRSLGFNRVGDALIMEIAGHLLNEWSDRGVMRSEPSENGWLMPPGYWDAFLPEHAGELVAAKIIVIRPISRLMPVVRLEFNLIRLADAEKLLPFAELTFMPALRRAAAALPQALKHVREQIEKNHGANIAGHPAHVQVEGMKQLLADFAKSSRAASGKAHTAAEIKSIVAEIVNNNDQAGTVLLRFS